MEQAPHDPSEDETAQATTWFGYRRVTRAEKIAGVKGVFDSVAQSYDLMNDLMSLGVHRLWKAAMVEQVAPRPAETILDVAGGTGDIAFRLRAAAPESRVTICDLTPAMLRQGRDRAIDRNWLSGFDWICGNAEALPFSEMRFDAYTIAFGLRNVADPKAALAEAYRTLRPGGRFLCLEFSQVALPWLARLYDLYSFRILPWLGEAIAKDRESYLYLAESIRRFPAQDELAGLIAAAGFRRVGYRNFSGGIVALHSAWRI